MSRPPDLERAVLLFREVFGPDIEVLCSFCNEHPAAADTWCPDCNDLYREHIGPLPLSGEARPGVPPGACGWCAQRPAIEGSVMCMECGAGSTEPANIRKPLTDEQVRELGYVSTARGWVARPGSFGGRPRNRVDRLSSECPGCIEHHGADATGDPWRCVIHDMPPFETDADLVARVRRAAREILVP